MSELRRHIMMQQGGSKIDHICLLDGAYIYIPIEEKRYIDTQVSYHMYYPSGIRSRVGGSLAIRVDDRNKNLVYNLFFVGPASIGGENAQLVICYSGTNFLCDINSIKAEDITFTYVLKQTASQIRKTVTGTVLPNGFSLQSFFGRLPTGNAAYLRISGGANYPDAQFKFLKFGDYEIFPYKKNGEYGVICNGEFYGNSAGVGYITGE